MITLLAFVFVIGVLVFVHELGHFLAARSVGVRVERFSLGFPPRLVSFIPTASGWVIKLFFYKRNEEGKLEWGPVREKTLSHIPKNPTHTEYCVALVPLGGYVKMAGAVDESMDAVITGGPDEFTSKNRFQQAYVLSAGVLMNILLAVLIFSGITYYQGVPEVTNEPVVMQITPGFPAEKAGIQSGDRIVSIDGQPIATWQEMTALIHNKPNQPVQISWQRQDQIFHAELTPKEVVNTSGASDKPVGLIGISGGFFYRKAGLGESLTKGLTGTGIVLITIPKYLQMIITGRASFKELGGPILIFMETGKYAKAGFLELLYFMALISINLAFINILPIPALDGGHLLIVVIEGIFRKALSIKTKTAIQQVGMALLLILFFVVMINDITRLFGW